MLSSRHDESRRSGPLGWVYLDLLCLILLAGVGSWRAVDPAALSGPLAVASGVAFTFLAPGSAFVALLFPGRSAPRPLPDWFGAPADRTDGEIGGWERLLLSVAMSVFIVPFAGHLVNVAPFEIAPQPVLLTLGTLTLVLTVGAWVRRQQLPPQRRYRVPVYARLTAIRRWVRRPDRGYEVVLNVLLVVGVVLATSSVVFAVAVPKAGETFTEFAVATNGSEPGSVVAGSYPRTFTVGESKPVAVSITNKEGRRTRYTVVTQAQHVRLGDDGNITAVDAVELDRRTVTVAANTTRRQRIAVQPTQPGENVRLVVLLYRGEPPAQPSLDTAYRQAHFWVDVTPADGEAA